MKRQPTPGRIRQPRAVLNSAPQSLDSCAQLNSGGRHQDGPKWLPRGMSAPGGHVVSRAAQVFLDIDALASNISHTAAVSIVGAYINLEVL
jgi:hypothetical protein